MFSAVILLSVGAISLARHFQPIGLTGTGFASKLIQPPDDSCDQLQRKLSEMKRARQLEFDSTPLPDDEVAVFRAVIKRWEKGGAKLNLSNRTGAIANGIPSCLCLQAAEFETIESATRTFHLISREAVAGLNVVLVESRTQRAVVAQNDPGKAIEDGTFSDKSVDKAFGSGISYLSEVAFDRKHQHALVSYSFYCGPLCGSGGTWLLEKKNGVWSFSPNDCGGGWIS